ncbi:hypothetical protein Moror_6999 [Moniliophthora roreri MCA 2997]|uniref:Uncharacterized protein n=1 Tax=Moniliophthora roreri (strain MCA 2997) TaxID=1381753 RepID=V2XUF5_MONRO|nr:hypothetical protein Moror_6999 [Moniliophthora roreri MCA 2997]
MAQERALTPYLSTYNISLNFSSIGSLFSYPSRLLAKIRRIEDTAGQNPHGSLPNLDTSSLVEEEKVITRVIVPEVTRQSFPGPWGFFTSGYMVGLMLLMVLIHRIENVVVPTRIPHFPISYHARRSRSRILLRRIYDSFLPLDMSKTSTRLVMHFPTLYLMCRSLLLWSLVLVQAAGYYPSVQNGYLYDLRVWSESKEMADICWHTFCAICGAFCVEAFVKGLDGVSVAFGAHMQANTSPFNLVGYSFLLYAYSSPITHVDKPDGLPSRPDKHVLATITIPLLQLTIFHMLSIRKRWSSHRFLPTALSSFLSLLHFHLTLFSHSFLSTSVGEVSLLTAPSNGTDPGSYSHPSGVTNYPILNYIPNMFETVLILLISLTIFLNVTTQLLLTGRIIKPLLGLGLNGAGEGSWIPPWEEDFGVVLLRVGTASLEATGLRGWGNEVTGVMASLPSDSATSSGRSRRDKVEHGTLQMDRTGVVKVIPGSITTVTSRGRRRTQAKERTRVLKGWNNEIKDINVARGGRGATGGRRVWGIPGFFTTPGGLYREIRAFGRTFWDVCMGALRLFWDILRARKLRGRFHRALPREDSSAVENEESDGALEEDADEQDYSRFLRGEHVTDDEGDDDEWVNESDIDSAEGEAEEEDGTDETDDEGRASETVGLYYDLGMRGSTPGATSSAMLAHMAYSGSSPLTRRRYGALLGGTTLQSDIRSPSPARRPAPSVLAAGEESRRNCVICTVEPRQIICWPCRCLSIIAAPAADESWKDIREYSFLKE